MLRKSWMLLLPLLLATLACGSVVDGILGSDDEAGTGEVAPVVEPAAEQNNQPVVEEQQAEAAAEEQQALLASGPELSSDVLKKTLSSETFAQFDSYIVNMLVQMDGSNTNNGDPVNLEMQLNMQGQREPSTVQIDLDLNAVGIQGTNELPGGEGSLNLIVTPEKTYMEIAGGDPDSCYAMPTDPNNAGYDPEELLFGAQDFFDSEVPAELLLVNPSEQVNGVNAAHYRAENIQDTDIDDMDVDVWVAADSGYVVKFVAQGNGGFEMEQGVFMDGTIFIEYNLTNVNQGINVLIPENCEEFNLDVQ